MIRENDCMYGDDHCKEIIRGCGTKCNVCDVSGTLEVFKEFNEVYKERLKKTEEVCGDVSELKIKTLEDWVADLTEQNTMLVETVEALEREALYRLELGINAQRCNEFEIKDDGTHSRFFGLKKDVDGYKKGPHDGDKQKSFLHGGHENELGKDCKLCQEKGKHGGKVGFMSSCSSDDLQRSRDCQIEELQQKLRESEEEIEFLKKNLVESDLKLKKINEEFRNSEKGAREMRAALTAEVADKHDQTLALRRDVQHLEEKLRQADMQTHFKDDIIKEMRKEIKIANNKINNKERMINILEERSRVPKGQHNECSGCSSVTKVIIPQLVALKKKIDSSLCDMQNRVNSSKTAVQRYCEAEEVLTDINKCLAFVLECANVMTNVCLPGGVDSSISDPFASDFPITEIYRGKPCNSSSHTSSLQFESKPHVTEMPKLSKNSGLTNEGEDLEQSSQLSCDKLLEELQYLREKSEDDQRVMVQLENEMKSLLLTVNSRNFIINQKDDSIICLREILVRMEECFVLGFSNAMAADNHSGSSKNERLFSWKKTLLEQFRKAKELIKEVEDHNLTYRSERDELFSCQQTYEQKIKNLRDQLSESQKGKEKILEKLCALEAAQKEQFKDWKPKGLGLPSSSVFDGGEFDASRACSNLSDCSSEVVKLLSVIKCQENAIKERDETISRLMKDLQNTSTGQPPGRGDISQVDSFSIQMTVDKILYEVKSLSRIIDDKEQQFMQLDNDLASFHQILTCAEKELAANLKNTSGSLYNVLCILRKDLCTVLYKTKEYVTLCKESERSIVKVRSRITVLINELKCAHETAANSNQQAGGSSIDCKPSVIEPRIKIASLEKEIACLKEQVMQLNSCLQEKYSYIKHLEDSLQANSDLQQRERDAKNVENSQQNTANIDNVICDESSETVACSTDIQELKKTLYYLRSSLIEIIEEKENVADHNSTQQNKFMLEHKEKIAAVGKQLCQILEALDKKNDFNEEKSDNKDQQSNLLIEHNDMMKKLNEDFNELNLQLVNRDKMIENLQETIALLENSLQIEQHEVGCLSEKLKTLVTEKRESEELHEKTIQELEKKVSGLEAQLKESQEANLEVRNKMNITCKVLFAELKDHFERCCKEMVWQIEAADNLNETNVQLTESVKCLQDLLQVMERKYIDCKLKQELAKDEINVWKSVVDDVRKELCDLHMAKIQLQNEKDDLESQLESQMSDLQKVKLQLENEKCLLKSQLQSQLAEREKSMLSDLQKARLELEKEKCFLESQMKIQLAEKEDLVFRDLQKTKKELHNEKRLLESQMKSQLAERENTVEVANKEVNVWKAVVEDVRKEMCDLQKRKIELEDQSTLLEAQLKSQIVDYENAVKDISKLEETVEYQESEINSLKKESQRLNSELQKLNKLKKKPLSVSFEDASSDISNDKKPKRSDEANSFTHSTTIYENFTISPALVLHESSPFNRNSAKASSPDTSSPEVISSVSSSDSSSNHKMKVAKLKESLQKKTFENFTLQNKISDLNGVISELQENIGKTENSNITSRQLGEAEKEISNGAPVERMKELEGQLKMAAIQLYQSEEKCARLTFELELALNEVDREKKIGEVYCLRIEELRAVISEKCLEINRWESQYNDMKNKFLESQTNRSDLNKEIIELKKKLSEMNSSKRDLAIIRETFCTTHKDIVSQLKSKLGRLEQASSLQKIEMQSMIEELIKKQNQLLEYAEREVKIQECITLKEHEWMQRCQEGQLEILRLSEILCELKDELDCVKQSLETERSQHCIAQKRLSDALNCVSSLKCEMGKKDICMAKLQDALRNTGLKVVQHVNRIDQLESCTNQWQQETWELRTMLTKALKERSDCEDELCKKTEEVKKLHFEMCKLRSEKDNLIKEA